MPVNEAIKIYLEYIERLKGFRILDPACGSGNFLYLSLVAIKNLEHQAGLDIAQHGFERKASSVGPENLLGIEINSFAAELARVSVWIGEIQWMREHGFNASRDPILKPLNTIECRDALLNPDGSEAEWPTADVIVGNPPFLGAKLMKSRLGPIETDRIRTVFAHRLPGFTDLVCYWFEKARDSIVAGRTSRAGFVATNSIAKNTNLPVMRRIAKDLVIFDAWRDEPWIIDGAAVRVALACFADAQHAPVVRCLDGSDVSHINPNLSTGLDVSVADPLKENVGASLLGIQKSGPFDIPGSLAREFLSLPVNPNGSSNASVLRPFWNGDDLSDRPRDNWIIDLPRGLAESDAALFEGPFEYLRAARYDPDSSNDLRLLKEVRAEARDMHARKRWWEQYWPRPEMRRAIGKLERYLVTGETTEHRIFVWLRYPVLPDKNLIVIVRDDDTIFGILQSRSHEAWSTGIGNRMGVGNQRRYNASYVFETFPFPEGLTPNIPAADYASDPRAQAIAAAAARLNELRENWLNPPDLVKRVPEIVPGYPDRILPVDEEAAAKLKKRTLTNLYNERPAWLDNAHRDLDAAVAAAYGWTDWGNGLPDEEILERLFKLNQERAAAGR
jgi:type II restriction/modification system DNA methylase subunit YeeA